jgi:hypothetical protein
LLAFVEEQFASGIVGSPTHDRFVLPESDGLAALCDGEGDSAFVLFGWRERA